MAMPPKILVLESHAANVSPKVDISLLGITQDQHGEIYLGNYQIRQENRGAGVIVSPA